MTTKRRKLKRETMIGDIQVDLLYTRDTDCTKPHWEYRISKFEDVWGNFGHNYTWRTLAHFHACTEDESDFALANATALARLLKVADKTVPHGSPEARVISILTIGADE